MYNANYVHVGLPKRFWGSLYLFMGSMNTINEIFVNPSDLFMILATQIGLHILKESDWNTLSEFDWH